MSEVWYYFRTDCISQLDGGVAALVCSENALHLLMNNMQVSRFAIGPRTTSSNAELACWSVAVNLPRRLVPILSHPDLNLIDGSAFTTWFVQLLVLQNNTMNCWGQEVSDPFGDGLLEARLQCGGE